MKRSAFVVLLALLGACSPEGSPPPAASPDAPALVPTTTEAATKVTTSTTVTTLPVAVTAPRPSVRVLLVGDVMLGRNVAPVVRSDPEGVFEEVRLLVSQADIAGANLESPLTHRPHIAINPYALEADPAGAALLAEAGFDLVSVANNHAGDAGRASVMDTIAAVEDAGMAVVGGGAGLEAALQPHIVAHEGIGVAFLAFDATRAGIPAGSGPGIASWDPERVKGAIAAARGVADIVVVSVHGGVEYLATPDRGMRRVASDLVEWGADVVWGHHPHVAQPIAATAGPERPAVVATSLGNFLFDQGTAATRTGAVLEVLADGDGVVAYRVGTTEHGDRRVHFEGWHLPEGDAVLLDLEWWTLVRPVTATPRQEVAGLAKRFTAGDIVDAALGDATGDGRVDLVVAFRHPLRSNPVNSRYPERQWADAQGRSAHLGVYRPDDLTPLWVAGSLFRPVVRVAPCDGGLAVAFSTLDSPAVVAAAGWVWQGFAFAVPVELPGAGEPACADVDGDGHLDPLVLGRAGVEQLAWLDVDGSSGGEEMRR